MTTSILDRLDARDRALFVRWVMSPRTPSRSRRAWTAVTHLGGARVSLAAAIVPLLAEGALHQAATITFTVLVLSHLLVQAVKRTVGRPRPSKGATCATLIAEPDRFSFPSGHAAAAMSVAFGYSLVFPALTTVLGPLAIVVGLSRVCLGVHYPGDVVAGQLIALVTGLAVVAL